MSMTGLLCGGPEYHGGDSSTRKGVEGTPRVIQSMSGTLFLLAMPTGIGQDMFVRRVRKKSRAKKQAPPPPRSRWRVDYTDEAAEQAQNLPEKVRNILDTLVAEIEAQGPVRGNWKNYSKLEGQNTKHHCHLRDGRPTYVACWEVIPTLPDTPKLVSITYAGTREKAPY